MAEAETWDVRFASGALEDLVEIIQYILDSDGVERAKEFSVLLRTDVKNRLSSLPHRGHRVPELEHVDPLCREIHHASYRIIYQPDATSRIVWVLLIVHTRRSLQDMLVNRLLTRRV